MEHLAYLVRIYSGIAQPAQATMEVMVPEVVEAIGRAVTVVRSVKQSGGGGVRERRGIPNREQASVRLQSGLCSRGLPS